MSNHAETWPTVEYPVVLIDDGDVILFEEGEVEAELEPWMAYYETFEFYDARGRKLRSGASSDRVCVMVDPYDETSHADEVLTVLKKYFAATESNPRADSGPLRRFIERLEAYATPQ